MFTHIYIYITCWIDIFCQINCLLFMFIIVLMIKTSSVLVMKRGGGGVEVSQNSHSHWGLVLGL